MNLRYQVVSCVLVRIKHFVIDEEDLFLLDGRVGGSAGTHGSILCWRQNHYQEPHCIRQVWFMTGYIDGSAPLVK